MPQKPLQACHEPGCLRWTREAYCPDHIKNNHALRNRAAYDHDRNMTDAVRKMYRSAAWEIRFHQSFFAAGNVICQRLENGVQCRWPVDILHHLISPRRRPDLFFTYSNVVGVCHQHHPVTEGEPVENLGPRLFIDVYVPTKLPTFKV
jgi:hypothetical protein